MNDAKNASTLDIREELCNLVDKSPAGGFWHDAKVEPHRRNSFTLRLVENGEVFTVTITHGGAITR